jgi:hypothetical protein
MIAACVYVLCAATSATCASLLFRALWIYRSRARALVLWSACSFATFAVSNALAVADLVVLRDVRLAVARAATACLASALLLVGLITEGSR